MKRSILILMILVAAIVGLSAQRTRIIERIGDDSNVVINLTEDDSDFENDGGKVHINFKKTMTTQGESSDAAFFGIFVEDITFPKAQALNFTEQYGIIITGVSKNTPAWEYRLLEDDIIMAINGEKVMNTKTFDRIRAKLRAGDQIVLEIFRGGSIEKIDMVLGSRASRSVTVTETSTKKKLSPGYGGGTWIPMYFAPDMTDVNNLLVNLGFDEQPKDGFVMYGFGGKGNVGKGYFIGGYIAGHEDTQKTALTDSSGISIGSKWMRYSNSMGGVTFDKRVPITSKLISSAGLMLGGGSQSIEVTNTNAQYDWSNLGDDTFFTNYILSRGYVVVQPRVELMYRILGWLAIRAEVGYTYGYAPSKSWKIRGISSDEFSVVNSPSTEYQGLNVSIGPWFGF